jgi:PAS domain S-box-containing protein
LELLVRERTQQLQQEIKEKKRLIAILESTSDMVAMATPGGKIIYVNSAGRQMLGWKNDDDTIGRRISDAHPEWAYEVVRNEGVPEAISKGIWTGETALLGSDGREITVSQVIMSHNSPAGELEYISTIVRDITDLKRAENTIKESEERFRELTDLLPEAIFEMDGSGNVMYANKSATEYFGYTRKDLRKGLQGLDLIDPKDRHRAKANIQRIYQGEKGGLNEYLAIRKDGSNFPAMFHSTATVREGIPVGLRGIIIDISEKKNLEDMLRQAQKMEAIGTLAGGIAHDFNNILSGVLGYVELALIKSENDPVRQYLLEIRKAGERASSLTAQILAFSRQGKQDSMPVQPWLIIKEALKLLRATIPATIEIKQIIDPKCESALVIADPTQIHQIMMNLCTNAYHAMRESGGVLEVTLTSTEIAGEDDRIFKFGLAPGSYLLLTVTDTGHGIDDAVLERIFEPYFSTKSCGEGTGMGLATVHGIVRSYQGHIAVESEPGSGTTFQVLLPLAEFGPDIGEDDAGESMPEGTEQILVVDDEELIVTILRENLSDLGYDVTVVTSSAEALNLFKAHPEDYDLVITDQTMPHMTGGELSSKLINIRPDIPIILCTGYSEIMNEVKAKAIGIREFIMKPIVLRVLAKTIRKVLDD